MQQAGRGGRGEGRGPAGRTGPPSMSGPPPRTTAGLASARPPAVQQQPGSEGAAVRSRLQVLTHALVGSSVEVVARARTLVDPPRMAGSAPQTMRRSAHPAVSSGQAAVAACMHSDLSARLALQLKSGGSYTGVLASAVTDSKGAIGFVLKMARMHAKGEPADEPPTAKPLPLVTVQAKDFAQVSALQAPRTLRMMHIFPIHAPRE